MQQEREAERVHILGTGSIGKFLAHSIRSVPGTPLLTLMFHRPAYVNNLKIPKCHLRLTSDGVETEAGPFDVELSLPARKSASDGSIGSSTHLERGQIEANYPQFVSNAPIKHLIVTVKAHQTVAALKPLKHRLTSESTILFCQNGMGTIEEVLDEIWPESEEDSRPNMMQSVNSHGVHATGTFSAIHAGHGVLYLSIIPPTRSKSSPKQFDSTAPAAESSMHLLRTITRVPLLVATAVPHTNLLQRALEKLAVNCVINPLTVMLDCRNGDILFNFALQRAWRMLLAETSLVFRSLPELKGVPNIEIAFSPDRLEAAVVSIAERTAQNISSMLQDVRRGQQTEIEYMNGYVVRRGEQIGIKPVMNYLMTQMVKGKQNMVNKEVNDMTPFIEQKRAGERRPRGSKL